LLRIILASQSPRRIELLNRFGIKYQCIPAELNEFFQPGEDAVEGVQRIAKEKAFTVAQQAKSSIIIAADTIVVCNRKVLGKPLNEDDARDKLSLLSGKKHEVITGLCVLNSANRFFKLEAEITAVYFRRLTEKEISNYIATGEPMDKAGAYGIQGLGAVFVEGIEGCFFNVVGLPLHRLYKMLNYFGINILTGGVQG